MKINVYYENGESVTNLSVASAIYDAFKPLNPSIDMGIVGHLIESQAIHDSRVKDYGYGKCESRAKENS